MKTYIFTLLLSLTALIFSTESTAQKKGSEGKIVYDVEITGIDEDNPAYALMSDITMTVYYTKDFTRSDMDMGIQKTISVVDLKKEVSTTLIEAMGTKSKIVTDLNEIEETMDGDKVEEEIDIEYTNETKEIAGHTCKKAIITTNGTTIVLWTSEELDFNKKGMSMSNFKGLKGVPLEYEIGEGIQAMKMTATLVSVEKLDKSLFDVEKLAEGYSELTEEQMEMYKKMSGQ